MQKKLSLQEKPLARIVLTLSFLVIYVVIQTIVLLKPELSLDIVSARLQDLMTMIITYYFLGQRHNAESFDKKPNE